MANQQKQHTSHGGGRKHNRANAAERHAKQRPNRMTNPKPNKTDQDIKKQLPTAAVFPEMKSGTVGAGEQGSEKDCGEGEIKHIPSCVSSVLAKFSTKPARFEQQN